MDDESKDTEGDGQLLAAHLKVLCLTCLNTIEDSIVVDPNAPGFQAEVLPFGELICPTCTAVAAPGTKVVIPVHVAVGQHHAELVDGVADVDEVTDEPTDPQPQL